MKVKMPDLRLPDLRATARRVARELVAPVTDEVLVRPCMPIRQIRPKGVFTTAGDTWATFVLDDAAWSHQPADAQEQVVDLANAAWAALPGRYFKIRVGERPADAEAWGARYQKAGRQHYAVDADPLFDAHIDAAVDRQIEAGLTDVVVTVDVRLCEAHDGEPADNWEMHSAEVLGQLSNEGLRARPAPPWTVDWLVHSAAAPGHPVPEPPESPRHFDDVAEFTAEVDWYAPPFARAVRVTSGRGETVWVTALTVSTMDERHGPSSQAPWMSACLHAPFPVQLVVAGEVIDPVDAAQRYRAQATTHADEMQHLREHKLSVPDSTIQAHSEAVRLADELSTGDRVKNTQCRFVARLVVAAPTRRDLDERVLYLKKLYRQVTQVKLERTGDQVTAICELMPGMYGITAGYQREGHALLVASGVPNVTGEVGQRDGMYFGYTSGQLARRVVRFDPWYPIEALDQVAIYPVLGDPGAGRSTLGLRQLYESILAGGFAVAVDPAGEWTHLDRLPGAEGRVATVDFTAAPAGTCAPARLVPDPPASDFGDPYNGGVDVAAHRAAKEEASATRIALATDAVRALVDDDTWRTEDRRAAIKDAVADSDGDLWAAVDWLNRSDGDGGCEGNRRVARELTLAAHSTARLLFPPRDGSAPDHSSLLDAQVVILTLQGMQFPAPSIDRAHWTAAERAGALLMHLAAWLGRRLIEDQNRRKPRCRKTLMIDEASWLANWEQGTAWVKGFTRQARRWDCALFLLSQHGDDIARLDPQGQSFATGGFIGTTNRPDSAAANLAVVGAASGLEPVLKQLSYVTTEEGRVRRAGEFLWVDAAGRVERVRLDLEPFPELREMAYTTPGAVPLAKRDRHMVAV